MTNIQRQQSTVAKLVAVLAAPYTGSTNLRLNTIRRNHASAMTKAGYTADEARTSVQECRDMAELEVAAS